MYDKSAETAVFATLQVYSLDGMTRKGDHLHSKLALGLYEALLGEACVFVACNKAVQHGLILSRLRCGCGVMSCCMQATMSSLGANDTLCAHVLWHLS